jgi:hypothetical protein
MKLGVIGIELSDSSCYYYSAQPEGSESHTTNYIKLSNIPSVYDPKKSMNAVHVSIIVMPRPGFHIRYQK